MSSSFKSDILISWRMNVIGQIVRIAPNPRDPKLVQMFKDALKQPRNVMEGKMTDIRKRAEAANNTAAELLLSILKAGGRYTPRHTYIL